MPYIGREPAGVGGETIDGLAIKTASKETIWVPAAAMYPSTTNPCADLVQVETTALRPDLKCLDFDASSDEFAQFAVAFPKSWNEGTVTYQPFWTVTGTNTGTVAWQLGGITASSDDSINTAFGTLIATTALAHSGTSNDLMVSVESGAVTVAGSPAAGDLVFFQINRDVSADNQSGDARLLGIKLLFTTDASNDTQEIHDMTSFGYNMLGFGGAIAPPFNGVGFNFRLNVADESSDTTVYTYSDVPLGPAVASRVILVQTSAGNLIPGSDVSGITVGGTAMTLAVRSTSSEGNPVGAYDTEIWYKDLSDGTSGDVVVTYGANRAWQHTAVVTLTGTATSPHATATDTAGDPLSIGIAVEAGGIVFGAFTSNSNTSVTLSNNLTELYDENDGTASTTAGGAAIFADAATVTITGDFASAGSRKRGAAVSFSPLG